LSLQQYIGVHLYSFTPKTSAEVKKKKGVDISCVCIMCLGTMHEVC
jgi:hypothetical protein